MRWIKDYLISLVKNWLCDFLAIIHALFHILWGFVPANLKPKPPLANIFEWHIKNYHGKEPVR